VGGVGTCLGGLTAVSLFFSRYACLRCGMREGGNGLPSIHCNPQSQSLHGVGLRTPPSSSRFPSFLFSYNTSSAIYSLHTAYVFGPRYTLLYLTLPYLLQSAPRSKIAALYSGSAGKENVSCLPYLATLDGMGKQIESGAAEALPVSGNQSGKSGWCWFLSRSYASLLYQVGWFG
jgi:hypothetical protein